MADMEKEKALAKKVELHEKKFRKDMKEFCVLNQEVTICEYKDDYKHKLGFFEKENYKKTARKEKVEGHSEEEFKCFIECMVYLAQQDSRKGSGYGSRNFGIDVKATEDGYKKLGIRSYDGDAFRGFNVESDPVAPQVVSADVTNFRCVEMEGFIKDYTKSLAELKMQCMENGTEFKKYLVAESPWNVAKMERLGELYEKREAKKEAIGKDAAKRIRKMYDNIGRINGVVEEAEPVKKVEEKGPEKLDLDNGKKKSKVKAKVKAEKKSKVSISKLLSGRKTR
jgi:hypothetical protein